MIHLNESSVEAKLYVGFNLIKRYPELSLESTPDRRHYLYVFYYVPGHEDERYGYKKRIQYFAKDQDTVDRIANDIRSKWDVRVTGDGRRLSERKKYPDGWYKTQRIKWRPEHFPAGTLVKAYIDTSLSIDPDVVFEVSELRQNGVDSFIIKTTTPNKSKIIDGMETFNISYVYEIVKRGDGPSYKSPNHSPWFIGIVNQVISSHLNGSNHLIDFDRLSADLYTRFGIWVRINEYNPIRVRSRRKRKVIKAWLKQNLHRYYQKKSTVLQEESKENQIESERLMDDFDMSFEDY